MFDIMQRLFRKKYICIVVIVTMLFGIFGYMYNVLVVNRQKSMIIEFNYPGAEKGLNPDGSIFEISDLKSPEVIEKAKEGLKDKSIDTEFLLSRIFITSKVTGQSLDKIISAVHNEQNLIYMPTTFYVYYSQKNKFSKNESDIFMENLSKAYTEHFKEKYTEKNDILIYDPEQYDFFGKDYLEIYTIFKNKVDSMYEFINNHRSENRAFYSEDKANLGMAAKKIESFRDINLEKFYAYVVQNGISKNNMETIKRTDYLISDTTFDYDKLNDAAQIGNMALEQYESGIIAVAFIPSIDAKRNYYMSRTKTGLDDLTKKSYDNGISASRKLKDIEYYKSIYEKFSGIRATAGNKRLIAESMMINLSDELAQISQEVLKIDDEYLEHKAMNYFNIRLPEYSLFSVGLIVKFVILGFILALAAVMFMEFLEKMLITKIKVIAKAFSSMKLLSDKRGE